MNLKTYNHIKSVPVQAMRPISTSTPQQKRKSTSISDESKEKIRKKLNMQ